MILKDIVDLVGRVPLGERDGWDEYFMAQAYVVSLRSTCGSRRVGAVVVKETSGGMKEIVSSGYNGYPSGEKHCIDGGCPRYQARVEGLISSGEYREEYPCEAIHAEANALYQMQRRGEATEGCVLYCTTFPCRSCAEKILGAGIRKVYYSEGYPDGYSRKYLEKYGVDVEKVN